MDSQCVGVVAAAGTPVITILRGPPSFLSPLPWFRGMCAAGKPYLYNSKRKWWSTPQELLCQPNTNPLIEKEGRISNNGVTCSLSLPLCAVKMLPSWFPWKEGELIPLKGGVLQAPGHRNTLPLQLNQIWTPRWYCPRSGGRTAGLCCDGHCLRADWVRDGADTTGWWVIEHFFFF